MIARHLAALLVSVSLISAGCRGGPVPPADPSPFLLDLNQLATVSHPLAVPLGDAMMQIWGYVLGDSPGPLCGPVLGTSQGTLVTTLVRVDSAGAGWIARSRPGAGTLEFRFDQTGRATAEGEGVSGTAVGVARDTAIAPGGPPKDLSVTVAAATELAIVDGIGSSAVPFLRGTMKGRVRFTDSLGGLSTCARVWWTLQPAEGVKIPPPGTQHLVYSGLARTFQARPPFTEVRNRRSRTEAWMAEPTTATGDAAGSNTSAETHTTSPSTGGIVDKVRERAAAQLSAQKDRAFDGIGGVAQAVRQSTQQLRDQRHETLAGYVEQTADQIGRFAEQLRQKDLSELWADAQRLARRQPAIFIGSAFALGLCGARFLKSSTHHDEKAHGGPDDRSRHGSHPYSGGEPRQQYGGGSTRGIQRPTSQSGVSPVTSSTPVASGSTYASTSEPYPTASAAGARADGGAPPGASSGRTTGTSRDRSGDGPGSGGSSPTRPRRPATDTERRDG